MRLESSQNSILGEVCLKITDGKHGDCINQAGSGYYFISVKDVFDGKINYENARQIDEDDFLETHRRTNLEAGDILITNTGTIGRMALVKGDEKTVRTTFQKSVAILKPDKDKVHSPYLYYYLQSEMRRLAEFAAGTTQKNLLLGDMKKFNITLHSFPEQLAIADIFSSLDDKIELNRQMNKTIEEMAQAIFKEWFIDFGPFRDGGMQDSELGPIPAGWKVYNLDQLIDTVSITHKLKTDSVVFLNTSDILDGQVLHRNYSSVHGLPGQAKKSIRKLDILFTEIRPANKRFALIDFDVDDYVVSTKLMVLRTKAHVNAIVIYNFLTSPEMLQWLQHLAESRSGTFPQITFDQVRTLRIALPDGHLLDEYAAIAWSSFRLIKNNCQENQILTQIRDTLLPKLMSGELRVPVSDNAG